MTLKAMKIADLGNMVQCPHCGETILVMEDGNGVAPEPKTRKISWIGKNIPRRTYTKHMTRRGGRRYQRWSPVEDKQLVSLIEAGHTARNIAKVMKRTKKSVQVRASLLERSIKNRRSFTRTDLKHKWSEQDNARMLKMLDKGEDCETIGKELGRTTKAIYERTKWLKYRPIKVATKADIRKSFVNPTTPKNKYNVWSEEEKQMLKGMWTNGYTAKSIARRMKRTTVSVYSQIKTMKKTDSTVPSHLQRHKSKQEEIGLGTPSQ